MVLIVGQAPPNWKVSVRTAQMIGGNLAKRMANRKKVTNFYRLRNQATHGGHLEDDDTGPIEDAASMYRELFDSFMRYGKRPDWSTIEMQSAFFE
jgi:hypothetical protein